MTKNKIRSSIKKKRNDLTINLREEYSRLIFDRLYSLDCFLEASKLFIYISFGSEVSTIEIINRALLMGKKVYVPKVEDKDMSFYEIDGFDNLIRSSFGIMEADSQKHPKYIASKASENDKMLMILPGLAFDKSGNRIGYGAGYYDRYLSRPSHKNMVKIALAYDFQIIDDLAVNKYDIPTDYIITERQLLKCIEYRKGGLT